VAALDRSRRDEIAEPSSCCAVGAQREDGLEPKWPAADAPTQPTLPRPSRLVRLPGGRYTVGTNASPLPQDGESPTRVVQVKPFAIDPIAVTNDWFCEFVVATGYLTDAERFGWSLVFAGFAAEEDRLATSAAAPSWWRRVNLANRRQPEGPHSSLAGRLDHPVVHVSWNDAAAFAAWAGGRLPTEAEWEYAAAGGRRKAVFPWGDREPDDTTFQPCNIWQGKFPTHNSGADGHLGTAPVRSFAPNAFGLFNMVGNTWEWCADAFRVRSLARAAKQRNEGARATSERLLKGGSYLCHRSYCYRYRIAARTGASADSSTGHVGFRVAFDD
jgi:formylglycine-generating enzyme required for sulfatase activity